MTDDADIAELFHENTKIWWSQVGVNEEPTAHNEDEFLRVRLPQVKMVSSCGLEEAISRRRSHRSFAAGAWLPLQVLSRLLLFSCSYTNTSNFAPEDESRYFRAAPSAGASYPIDVYPIIFRVAEIPPGAYAYSVEDHSLELIRTGQFDDRVAKWMLNQPYIADASVAFILAGNSDRIKPQYGERGYRYMLLEAGHIAQNLCLLSTGLKLGSLVVGGFIDSAIDRLVDLDEVTKISLYGVVVGVTQDGR